MLARWFPDLFPIADPVLVFGIVLVLFLFAPIAMSRVRLPGMIGLLLAGAILGPHAFGVLARDASFVLLGSVGLIYIMFTAALEVDLGVFRKYYVQGVVFGILTFSIPQGVGTLMAYYVLGLDWLAAILLASMFASHTLLAYPLVSRLGLANNASVTTTVGGTIITDTGALLVLAVIAGMSQGEVDEPFWWRLGVSLVIFVGAVLFGLPKLGRWFFRRVAQDGPAEFVFVLTSVFIVAALSHAAGLEPIVGAFLAGLALNRLIPHHGPLMNRIVFTGDALFIPFFLLSVGMILDPAVLFGGFRTWFVAIGMTVTVIATKWLAAMIARIVFRYRREEGRIMFGLSVVQAAATLAAVMVGHRLTIFDDAVVNGTIVMILVTCVLGPWVVSRAAPILAGPDQPATDTVAPGGILIPLSAADQADSAVELALLLRKRGSKACIYPVFVAGETDDVSARMAEGDKILARAVTQASAADCPAETIKRVHDRPGRVLARTRKELGARTVVLPWDGAPSAGGADHGRVLDELLQDQMAEVVAARLAHPLGTCNRLVVVFPPGAAETRGLESAVDLVERLGKQLCAPAILVAQELEVEAIAEAFARRPDPIRVQSVPYPGIRLWFSIVSELISDNDLVVLYAIRTSEPTFTPESRGMAQRIAAAFPRIDSILYHPPVPGFTAGATTEVEGASERGRAEQLPVLETSG